MRHFVRRMICMMVLTMSVFGVSAAARANTWHENANKASFYLDANGKRLKNGIHKINRRYYLFDKTGRQHVGWQEVDGKYYFFRIRQGKGGYMVKNNTINGIKLNAKGIADTSTSANKRKLKVMVKANKVLESLTRNRFKYTKRQKLKMCFDYSKQKFSCCNIGSFNSHYSENWDLYYAERVLLPTDSMYRADCYTYGCAMAYLANACGAKAACISSGGHGWAEVDGCVCDSNWALVDSSHNYFMRSYSLREGGTPSYGSARAYVKNI